MATFQTFEDIEAWQLARQLTRGVYRHSREGAFAKDFALRNQIHRASISVTSNVAEDYERDSRGDLIRFLAYAKGSAGEVRSQLYVALDEGYLSREEFERLFELASHTINKLGALRSYLLRVSEPT